MRRDMRDVLERQGRGPALCVFARYKPAGGTDEDGPAIDTCVAHMSMMRSAGDTRISGLRFLGGRTTRFIAEGMVMSMAQVSASLNAPEELLEGIPENGQIIIRGES